jgi:hypothetical protein
MRWGSLEGVEGDLRGIRGKGDVRLLDETRFRRESGGR